MNKFKRMLTPAVLLLILIVIALPVAAQENNSATLAPIGGTDGYTVGDPVLWELTVQHPAGTQLITPDLPETWGDFTVVTVSLPQTVTAADDSKTTTITIDTRLFVPGEFQTPPLVVQLANTAGQLTAINIAPVPVTVQSVLVDGDTELRDIKPPVDLPAGNILLLFLSGLILGLLALGAAYWLWRNGRTIPVPVDNRPAYIIALADLADLEAHDLPARRQIKPYYTSLADILRRFIGYEYHVPVQERTTTEIDAALRQLPIAPELRRKFISLLRQCDLVKFADAESGPSEAAKVLAEMRAAIQFSQTVIAKAPGELTVSHPVINLTPTPMEVRS